MKKKKFLFQASLFSIILLGILMIYSSSSIWAEFKTGNPFYYVLRQGLFFIIGLFGYFIACKIDYHFWLKHANQIFFICLILLILVLIPGIGMVRGGARSWIGIGDFSIQPAEFMKIGLIIFTAKFMTKNEGILQKNRYFYLYMIFVGVWFDFTATGFRKRYDYGFIHCIIAFYRGISTEKHFYRNHFRRYRRYGDDFERTLSN